MKTRLPKIKFLCAISMDSTGIMRAYFEEHKTLPANWYNNTIRDFRAAAHNFDDYLDSHREVVCQRLCVKLGLCKRRRGGGYYDFQYTDTMLKYMHAEDYQCDGGSYSWYPSMLGDMY